MTSHDLQAEFATLRHDLDQVRSDIAALTRSATNGAAEAAGELAVEQAARLRATLEMLEVRLAETGRQVQQRAGAGAAALGRHIADQPLASLAIAFGAGLLIGKVFDR